MAQHSVLDNTKMVEVSTILNHFRFGKYCYVLNNGRNFLPFMQFLGGSFILKALRNILRKHMMAMLKKPQIIFQKPNLQIINIVNPPGGLPELHDFCDACPDAILYEGILQPSCVLESNKQIQIKQV